LFKVFDHLFNLPALSVILDDIQGGEMKIRRNKIRGLLSFLFHHDHSHFAQTLECPDKSGDLKGFVLAIQEKGDLPIGRTKVGKGSDLVFFTIHPENGRGFELRDHMVPTFPTDVGHTFRSITY
jgi:hypothetical protein